MNKFKTMPSATGVMELCAKYKNVSVEDLVLDFANMSNLQNLVSLNIKEFPAMLKSNENGVKDVIIPFEHKQYYGTNTKMLKLNDKYDLYRLKIMVDDFNFNVFMTVAGPEKFEGLREVHKDYSKAWRKMLFEFDKDYMFCEHSELMEYQKNKALESFYNKYDSSKTEEKTL